MHTLLVRHLLCEKELHKSDTSIRVCVPRLNSAHQNTSQHTIEQHSTETDPRELKNVPIALFSTNISTPACKMSTGTEIAAPTYFNWFKKNALREDKLLPYYSMG